ncbi:MAG: DMT family transporter [Patescibacteria group bacterium]
MKYFNFSKKFTYAFLGSFAWAITIILGRIILNNGENAFNLAFWIAFLALPYWLFVFKKHFHELKDAPKINWLIIIAIGLISTAGVNIVEVFALKYSTALNYSLLIRSVTLFTIIFSYLFLGEKITLKKIILLILIFFGTFLLITNGEEISFSRGDIFTLIEAMLISLGNSILAKVATNRMSPSISSSASFLVGLLPIALIALSKGVIAIPKMSMLVLIFAVVNVCCITCRFLAYKNATASYVTMIFSMTPVMVFLMAMPFLGETITLIQIAGGILIILAGIFTEKLKI